MNGWWNGGEMRIDPEYNAIIAAEAGETVWAFQIPLAVARRAVDGVPERVDRLTALGNAVVPQVAEWLGRLIVDASTADSRPDGAGRAGRVSDNGMRETA